MALKVIHDKVDDIPEQYRDLYTEKDGKWVLTGIVGVKTDADVAAVQEALRKERNDHKTTKATLAKWGELDPDQVQEQLDTIPALTEAAKGKLSQEQIDELVEKRIGAKLKPVEKRVTDAEKRAKELEDENTGLKAEKTRRVIHDAIRAEAVKTKMIDTAQDDALLLAERIFEVTEEGKVVAKDQVGVTPGISPDIWLTEMQDKRPHWWPASQGGGAGGGNGGGGNTANNPWSAANWNLTEQGKYIRAQGMEKATQMAKQAGLDKPVGHTRPADPTKK
jgi:hypothetical protein